MRKILSSVIIASAILTSSYAYSSPNQEVSLKALGHSDGTDQKGNWVAVYMYEIHVKEGENSASGIFSITTDNNDIESKKIRWVDNQNNIRLENNLGMYPDIIASITN